MGKKLWLYLTIVVATVLGALSLLGKRGDAGLKQKMRNLEQRRRVYRNSDVETEQAELRLARKLRELNEKLESKPETVTDPDDAALRLRRQMGWGSDES